MYIYVCMYFCMYMYILYVLNSYVPANYVFIEPIAY